MSFLDGTLLREDNRLYLLGEGCKLPLTAGWAGRLAQSGGQVALGVRPDCVQLQVDGAGEPAGGLPSPALEMEVALVEFQGPATLVTCRRGGWRLTGTIPEPTGAGAGGRPHPSEGQRVMAHVQLEQAYLFDGLTGKTLLAGFEAG
jgi:hypothetical protein